MNKVITKEVTVKEAADYVLGELGKVVVYLDDKQEFCKANVVMNSMKFMSTFVENSEALHKVLDKNGTLG